MENELPKGWEEINIGTIVSSKKGRKPSSVIDEPRKGLVPYILIDEMEGKPIRYYTNDPYVSLVTKEDILLVWDGSIGKCASGLEGAIGSTMVALTAKDKIPTKFIEYLIKHLNRYIKETSTGTGLQHINKNFFKECIVPVPPLAEQQRIVAKLDTILARVNNCKRRLDKIPTLLKNFRQSVLAAAVSGELTKEWRENNTKIETAEQLINRIGKEREERYASAVKKAKANGTRKPTDFDNYEVSLRKEFDLFKLPDTWQWVDFRFIMSEDEAFCYGVVQPGTTNEKGNFLIRAGDIKNNTVETGELRTISKTIDEEYSRSRVHGGEILITVVGAGIGECGIVPDSCKGYNIARAVAKVPIKDFNVKYLLCWLNTSNAVNFMKGEAREVARPTLNLEQLRTIPIPLAPIEEQKEIVRKVEELFHFADSIEARYQKAKAWFDKLPQSILSKAFRGQLVPQDETDEPASVLLERIKKEKQQSTKPKTKLTSKTKKLYEENDRVSLVAEG
jgi:type I restriction enzyme, S subunit